MDVVLLKDELMIRFPDSHKKFKVRDLLLNNLTVWEDWGSKITCMTNDGGTFFLMGNKENVTSLFLNITNLRWRKHLITE